MKICLRTPSLVCLVLLVVGGACGVSPISRNVTIPNVYYVPLHSLPYDRGFYVDGELPQLRNAGASGSILNKQLRSIGEQAIRQSENSVRPTSGPLVGGGQFGITPIPRLIFANSILVSMLLPAFDRRPYGVSNPFWVSVTLEMSSPHQNIGIGDLIKASGFPSLAKTLRQRLERNKCMMVLNKNYLATVTAPRLASFQQFALLQTGLAIGFPSSSSFPPYNCGAFDVIIPYSEIASDMSPVGKALAIDVAK